MNRTFISLVSLLLLIGFLAAAQRFGAPPATLGEAELAALARVEGKTLADWRSQEGFTKNLGPSQSGGDVSLLQQVLGKLLSPFLPLLPSTGFFGPKTEEAVRLFQKQYALPVTGFVGPLTRTKLNELVLEELCPEAEGTSTIAMDLAPLDTIRKLPEDYVPQELVEISGDVKTTGFVCLKPNVADALKEMFDAAANDGVFLAVTSGFRRPEVQGFLYDYWHKEGSGGSYSDVAAPQHSEHQLGTAVDLTGKFIGYRAVDSRFAASPEARWLRKNAYRYGFVMSYPEGKENDTGYAYEPWHYRYVGPDVARFLVAHGITLNEYLSLMKYATSSAPQPPDALGK